MIGQSECGDLPGCVWPLPLAAAFHHDIRTYRDIYVVYLHIFMNHRNEEQLDQFYYLVNKHLRSSSLPYKFNLQDTGGGLQEKNKEVA